MVSHTDTGSFNSYTLYTSHIKFNVNATLTIYKLVCRISSQLILRFVKVQKALIVFEYPQKHNQKRGIIHGRRLTVLKRNHWGTRRASNGR